jgi:transcriptional regulator with XRE-family HTH domain
LETMNGRDIRNARTAAVITGEILCKKAGISRPRLSEIEREYRNATPAEEVRLTAALQSLISAKEKIDAFAIEVGWPLKVSG